MAVYDYTALDVKGKKTSGIIDAESSAGARQKLREAKIYPISINKTHEVSEKKSEKKFYFSAVFTRVKASDVTMMTRQLATLVGAGFPLVSAIDSLIPQTKSRGFKKILARLKDSIVEGNSFEASLSIYPSIFPPLYINMVRAGETSGTLEIVLERLAEIFENQQALNNRLKAKLAYPIFMGIIGSLVLFFLLTFIVPTLTEIFTDMKQVLPAPTRFLIATGSVFRSYWWMMCLVMVIAILAFNYIRKTEKGRYSIDRIVLTLPIVSTLKIKLSVARFARTLGSLLENGVSMLSALGIVKNIAGNALISESIEEASKEVGKGQSLGASFSSTRYFPNLSIQMIQVGEQSGELEKMLNKVADVYENDVESSIVRMTSLLEPVMILVMAVIVLFIVLSICLPIFEMNQLIK